MRPPQYAVCDPGSGQPNAGSLMDYAMSRADDLTSFDLGFNGPRCRTNPLGIKGCGEAGAVGAFWLSPALSSMPPTSPVQPLRTASGARYGAKDSSGNYRIDF